MPNPYRIIILPGDGIGPEVVASAEQVLRRAARAVPLEFSHFPCGAFHYRDTGQSIGPAAIEAVGQSHAVLFGAAGWPDIRAADGTEIAPQIDLRERFQLFAGLRPVRLFDGVPGPLSSAKVDMLVIREQTEGLFSGRHDPPGNDPDSAQDRMVISRAACERLFELAFAQARERRDRGTPGRVTLFDKANVLRSMALMRRVFDQVAARHPDIGSNAVYIDAACMQMVTDPARFDVVVMENQFGDIASEIAAGLVGGLGLAPSADIGPDHAVFQPSHGTAPDIAGKGVANPVAAILSAALLLDWLAARNADPACATAAEAIRVATASVLRTGPRTRDLGGAAGTEDVTNAILEALPA